ncbi:MAG: hypothetical protein R3C59_08410 [Planctomycetaceae bacterium]
MNDKTTPLSHADLLELKRWNTPTIYNGWEQITSRDAGRDCFNLEETHDFMPQMGSMVGYAVTVVIEEVEAFGTRISPGSLIHADKHGFLAVPDEDTPHLLEAARSMDSFECQTMIPAARSAAGKSTEELTEIDQACSEFGRLANAKFTGKSGEWE